MGNFFKKTTMKEMSTKTMSEWEENVPALFKTHKQIAAELGIKQEDVVPTVSQFMMDPEVGKVLQERYELTHSLDRQKLLKLCKTNVAILKAHPEEVDWMKSQPLGSLGQQISFNDIVSKTPNFAKHLETLSNEFGTTPEKLFEGNMGWYMGYRDDPEFRDILIEVGKLFGIPIVND